MTGVGTVLADDPLLTVRDTARVLRQPLRVVVDSRLRTPASATLLAQPGDTAVFCTEDRGRTALEAAGAAVHRVATERGRVDLSDVLFKLAELGINDVLVEAGPGLSGSFLAGGHVDELVIYQAPHMMGSETMGIITTPGWTALRHRLQLEIRDVRRVGPDLKVVARPVPSEAAAGDG
jgi:diaminohydroxyphosphoribosylaminopyrimidine deaminase/5-amino-6-(5-phosphoribosylamino)uracil reductase